MVTDTVVRGRRKIASLNSIGKKRQQDLKVSEAGPSGVFPPASMFFPPARMPLLAQARILFPPKPPLADTKWKPNLHILNIEGHLSLKPAQFPCICIYL